MTEYTIEIYKTDKRRKEGKKLIDTVEIVAETRELAEKNAALYTVRQPKLTVEVHETYREVRNAMSGKIVKEHYKTPFSCSVASESYWCS